LYFRYGGKILKSLGQTEAKAAGLSKSTPEPASVTVPAYSATTESVTIPETGDERPDGRNLDPLVGEDLEDSAGYDSGEAE